MSSIALITSTPVESKELRCKIVPQPKEATKTIFEGKLHGKNVVFTHCGIGKANAAHSTTLVLENYDIDFLILFGIGGAYTLQKTGDIAVAESENYAEEGVSTKEGWRSMEFMGLPLLKNEKEYYNTFPLEAELSNLAIKASKDCGFNVMSGDFITVSQCSGTRESGEVLRKRFSGLCENMEGAAVAHLCAFYRIPMIEIRGISNMVKDRDLGKWDIDKAASNCSKAVIELVRRLK
ncbi:MAG: futalosine hydrolase [Candidatus Methanoperedens sp.]|nr:futalosine hydrolase [Candidatus Methanoperedens sp.]